MSPTCTSAPSYARDSGLPTGCDVAVVGGGIVGLATARELLARNPGAKVVVLERAARIATGQTGANSGVIHGGIYYTPGSLKARLCVEGAALVYELCAERGIHAERVGKLIVAADPSELPGLDELERRGRANRVPGLRRLSGDELREVEPHVRGVAGLHSPVTGIVDFAAVAAAMADDVAAGGGSVVTGAGVVGASARGGEIALDTTAGPLRAGFAVFCAGHDADRLAVMCGAPADPRIVPFRGAYLRVARDQAHLVRGMVYPVPDPALPFLGVHLTRHGDEVLVGPSALLSTRRLRSSLAWPGTWRMLARFWRTGVEELRMAASTRAFGNAARRYVPELRPGGLERAFSGWRAQAVGRDGTLVDDFVIHETERALHVRNAPSPAATSSPALARLIADEAERRFGGG